MRYSKRERTRKSIREMRRKGGRMNDVRREEHERFISEMKALQCRA
jgi:hypothetical protein